MVGSLNVDIVVGAERLPATGETVLGERLERHPGGKGLNQAVAAARIGAHVEMIGAVGIDDAGTWLRQVLVDESIGSDWMSSTPRPSGTAIIEVDTSGANRIIVVPGANAALDPSAVSDAISTLDDVAVVIAQAEIPIDAIRAAMVAGRARGAITILNPAPATTTLLDVLEFVDFLIPNEHEAAILGSVDGARCVIVTRGDQGSVWTTSTEYGECPAFPVDAIDTVAAGDAFCGAFAAAVAEGREFDDALRWASAAGALATTVAGAVPSLPSRSAVQDLLDR